MSAVTFEPGSALIVEEQPRSRPMRKSDIGLTPGAALTASISSPCSGDVRELMGWAFAETTGVSGAAVRLRDGQSGAGEVFARINLAANESTRDIFTPPGIACRTGEIFLEVISGSVEGVIYWR